MNIVLQRRHCTKSRRSKSTMRHDATQVAKKKLSPPINTMATELHKMAHSSHHRPSPCQKVVYQSMVHLICDPSSAQSPHERSTPHDQSPSHRGSGGWCDDLLTKETGFFNHEPPPAPRKLMTACANELIQLQHVQSNGNLNDGMQYDSTKQNGDNYKDHNNNEDEDSINHNGDNSNGDNSDVFAGGDTFYGEGDDYEDDEGEHSHKQMWEPSHLPSPQQDQMTQVLWAKEAWKEACNYYEIEIGFNGEIIQMCVANDFRGAQEFFSTHMTFSVEPSASLSP
ncbi:hypothetical protein BD769DRAFT_1382479 [Suillus cothurnatus]|nr:hypothetical protein BD769DRAFT_1382479 [Suillus cothurnatus]